MKEVIYMYVKGVGWVPERETPTSMFTFSEKRMREWYEARTAWGRTTTIAYVPGSIGYMDGI